MFGWLVFVQLSVLIEPRPTVDDGVNLKGWLHPVLRPHVRVATENLASLGYKMNLVSWPKCLKMQQMRDR